jgi:hypothetical protein
LALGLGILLLPELRLRTAGNILVVMMIPLWAVTLIDLKRSKLGHLPLRELARQAPAIHSLAGFVESLSLVVSAIAITMAL